MTDLQPRWHDIKPGTKTSFVLEVVARADGSPVELPVLVVRGAAAGKTLLATAGVHGDEFEGMAAIRTPPLPLDRTYTCTVTASWKQNSRTITQERRVVVVPGQYAVANFVLPADTELIPAPLSSDYRSNR
jgi:hypothetical protein